MYILLKIELVHLHTFGTENNAGLFTFVLFLLLVELYHEKQLGIKLSPYSVFKNVALTLQRVGTLIIYITLISFYKKEVLLCVVFYHQLSMALRIYTKFIH